VGQLEDEEVGARQPYRDLVTAIDLATDRLVNAIDRNTAQMKRVETACSQ